MSFISCGLDPCGTDARAHGHEGLGEARSEGARGNRVESERGRGRKREPPPRSGRARGGREHRNGASDTGIIDGSRLFLCYLFWCQRIVAVPFLVGPIKLAPVSSLGCSIQISWL